MQAAVQLDHPYTLVLACLGLGELHRIKGNFPTAVPLLERAVTMVQRWDIPLLRAQSISRLGAVYARSGRLQEGISLLRDAVTDLDSQHARIRYATVVALLGEAQLLSGRIEEARASAERALAVARALGQRGDEAYCGHLSAEVASCCEPVDAGAVHNYLAPSLALATELGMRPLVAHCHLGLGKLYARTGKSSESERHLVTATAMYREMGMTYWLEKAEADVK